MCNNRSFVNIRKFSIICYICFSYAAVFYDIWHVSYPPHQLDKLFIVKMVFKYIFPLVFFSLIGVIAKLIIFGSINIRSLGAQIIFHIGSSEILTGSTWFLGILPISLILTFVLVQIKNKVRIVNNDIVKDVIIIILLSLLSFLATKIPFRIPFLLNTIFTTTLFCHIGYNCKNYILKIINTECFKRLGWISILFVLLITYINGMVNVSIPTYGNYILFLVGAIAGITMVFWLSSFNFLRFLDYFGKNSLIIFCLHQIPIALFTLLANHFLQSTIRPIVNMPIYLCIIGTLFVMIFSILIVKVISPIYYKAFTYTSSKFKFLL